MESNLKKPVEKKSNRPEFVKSTRNYQEYALRRCNPRAWSLSHINDIVLMKEISQRETTPCIKKMAEKRLAKLLKRQDKIFKKEVSNDGQDDK